MARQPDLSEQQPQTLAQVVELAFVRTGASSSRAMQEYAQRHDFELTHSTINLIRKGTYPSRPKDKTLQALSFLAGVPLNTVRSLAQLPPKTLHPFAAQLPPDIDELEPRPRAALLEMARLMLDLQRRQGDEARQDHDFGVSTASLADLGLSGEEVRNARSTVTTPNEG
jgi:hypothetical protein